MGRKKKIPEHIVEAAEKKQAGRPQIPIDETNFIKLCQIHCTLEEVAGFFKCSPDTIENWTVKHFGQHFSDVHKRYSADGKISMRRKMYQMANEGNVTMAIWLSKQYLGMKENREQIIVPMAAAQMQANDDAKGVTDDALQSRIEQKLLEAK
jgi:hypothetical protein